MDKITLCNLYDAVTGELLIRDIDLNGEHIALGNALYLKLPVQPYTSPLQFKDCHWRIDRLDEWNTGALGVHVSMLA